MTAARVARRVGPRGHRHLPHLFRRRPEEVHVPLQDHGVGDGRVEHPEGHGEAQVRLEQGPGFAHPRYPGRSLRRPSPRPLTEAVELALAQRPVDDDHLTGARLDGHRRVGHGRARSAPSRQPGHAGVAQLGQTEVGGGEGGVVAVVGEGGQSVDVVHREPGVVHRRPDGGQGQLVLAGFGDPSPLGVPGLTDPHQAGRPPWAGHGQVSVHWRRTSAVCSPRRGGGRCMTQGDPWATKGAPG